MVADSHIQLDHIVLWQRLSPMVPGLCGAKLTLTYPLALCLRTQYTLACLDLAVAPTRVNCSRIPFAPISNIEVCETHPTPFAQLNMLATRRRLKSQRRKLVEVM